MLYLKKSRVLIVVVAVTYLVSMHMALLDQLQGCGDLMRLMHTWDIVAARWLASPPGAVCALSFNRQEMLMLARGAAGTAGNT